MSSRVGSRPRIVSNADSCCGCSTQTLELPPGETAAEIATALRDLGYLGDR